MSAPTATPLDEDRAVIAADVARAGSIVAPCWPLTSFVAVNPLGGLTDQSFDDATATARASFTARTHLSLHDYRSEHQRGTITDADLDGAIRRSLPALAGAAPIDMGDFRVTVVDIVRWDLVHGPAQEAAVASRDADPVARSLDDVLTSWCATYVDDAHVPWAMPERELGFYRSWRAVASGDRRLAQIIGRTARTTIGDLPDDPTTMIGLALRHRGVDEADRVAALRALVLRTPGWASYARWCDDWAPADHAGARLRLLDLAAVGAALDHLSPSPVLGRIPAPSPADDALVGERVQAVMRAFTVRAPSEEATAAVAEVLRHVPDPRRNALWLTAHEWSFRDRVLARLGRTDGTAAASEPARPAVQLVFCIDVRSEGLRCRLEALGAYETFGFAGFFGVPVRWRQLGAGIGQARCPVLVSPRHEIAEVAIDDPADYLSACSAAAGLHDAFHAAKGGIASPFALAESAGWFAGPLAAARTLAPSRTPLPSASTPVRSRWWTRFTTAPVTVPVVDEVAGADLRAGLSLEERTLFAEAIVTTIGMARFAPLVVLCGHGSHTVNNPHASSLDCGACGGAPGGASARIAAAILNDSAVRAGLVERGIEIPIDTRFVAAEHDTTADVVTVLDVESVPGAHHTALVALQADLATAGEHNARDRAVRLPGSPDRVRDRGRDWAQVRPEWGLAGNGAFIIGPRSMTAQHDLAGRAFLHSYVAERDPDGVALETIMTAPLVVAQWISAQYYFSTVEPEIFGAGDKMLHNPVGGVGVVLGQTGDLAVGLPMQSVMYGDQRAHDPLRLMAVVQAPLDRIERIILRNPGLRQLVEGEWIHVVARDSEHDAWSLRIPGGGWELWQATNPSAAAVADLLTPLEIS